MCWSSSSPNQSATIVRTIADAGIAASTVPTQRALAIAPGSIVHLRLGTIQPGPQDFGRRQHGQTIGDEEQTEMVSPRGSGRPAPERGRRS